MDLFWDERTLLPLVFFFDFMIISLDKMLKMSDNKDMKIKAVEPTMKVLNHLMNCKENPKLGRKVGRSGVSFSELLKKEIERSNERELVEVAPISLVGIKELPKVRENEVQKMADALKAKMVYEC